VVRLLVDVDALCKLAHWDLLSKLPTLLGVPLANTSTLTSARFRAQNSLTKPDGKVFRNVEAAHVALHAIGQMAQPLSLDPAASVGFADIQGIDPGEAVLFATLVSSTDVRLLTGDKRALRALSELLPDVRAAVAGKIVIVEQVVEAALNTFGIDWLRERVCPWKHVDTSVSMIMGSRCDLSEQAVRENLASAIGEMRQLCDPSLL
jgi:hypothetical protein